MANATIPMLTPAIGLTGAELVECVQAGTSVRTTTGAIAALAPSSPPGIYTTAGLPNPAASAGLRYVVSDATSTAFGATLVGGGSNIAPVFSNGAIWVIG